MRQISLQALRVVAAAMYVATISWTPIAHAQTEVYSANPAVEAGHSGDCSVLHVESACALTGAIEGPKNLATELLALSPIVKPIQSPTAMPILRNAVLLGSISERGPPALLV